MDGDEERPNGGVALLGDAPRAEEADTDVAPDGGSEDVPDTAEVGGPGAPWFDDTSDAPSAVAQPDEVDTPEVTADDEVPDDVPAAEGSAEPAADEDTDEVPDDDTAPPADEAAADPPPEEPDASGPIEPVAAVRPVRRKWSLRRGAAVATVVLTAALAVSAFATSGSPAISGDTHFLDTARSLGHTIAPGQQEGLLVAAAHKICDRRENHSTTAERRATALSTDELTAIDRSFGGDSRAFTTLALDTYCSS